MKICMIGNSHTACLKLGWDLVSTEFPQVELVFFAARGTRMSGLRVKKDRLVTRNPVLSDQLAFFSGGLTEIVPQDYDAFVLCGLTLDVPRLPAGTSAALRRRAAGDYVDGSILQITLTKLRTVTDKTIWIGPSPLRGPKQTPSAQAMLAYPVLLGLLHEALADPNIVVLGQPDGSFSPDLTTLEQFMQGSMRLPSPIALASKAQHRSDNRTHMNAAFGALWLQQNLPRVIAA